MRLYSALNNSKRALQKYVLRVLEIATNSHACCSVVFFVLSAEKFKMTKTFSLLVFNDLQHTLIAVIARATKSLQIAFHRDAAFTTSE